MNKKYRQNMTTISWITYSLLILHTSQAYILLTANMEDVQSIAKQLASAPVVEKVQDIWQRASSIFQQQLNEPESRRTGIDNELKKDALGRNESKAPATEKSPAAESTHADDLVGDLIALGKNASVYITSIKSALENDTK